MSGVAPVSLTLGAEIKRDEAIDYGDVDLMRKAMMPVLRRHGYDIPGVADLCAIAALRALHAAHGAIVGVDLYARASPASRERCAHGAKADCTACEPLARLRYR